MSSCVNGARNGYKFYRAKYAEFSKFSNSISCFESGSEIYISSRQGLVLSDMGALDVLSNATLILMNNGSEVYIKERSYVLVKDMLKINSGLFFVTRYSEVLCCGIFEADSGSEFKIREHSIIKISPKGRIHIGPDSHFEVFVHSILELSTSDIHEVKQRLILKKDALFSLGHASTFRLLRGIVMIMEKSRLIVEHRAYIAVDGLLQINDGGEVHVLGHLSVGAETSLHYNNTGQGDSTLIIIKHKDPLLRFGRAIVRGKLTVPKGSYCMMTIMEDRINDEILLNSSVSNDQFQCYDNKDALNRGISEYKRQLGSEGPPEFQQLPHANV